MEDEKLTPDNLKLLREALEPFADAIAAGVATEAAVEAANLRKAGLTSLIGIAGYAGKHAVESRTSWAAWKRLGEALTSISDTAND